MHIPRRLTLLSACATLALASCNSAGTTVDLPQAIADARIIVDGVANVYTQITVLYPKAVSPAQQAAVAGYLSAARSALAQLSTNADVLTNIRSLQSIEAAVNAVLAIVGGVVAGIPGVPPEVTAGILAAQVLLPAIEMAVNQLQGQAVKAPTPAAMSVDQARRTLAK